MNNSAVDSVSIEPYDEGHFDSAARILAGAYATNPATLAILGDSEMPLERTRELFALRLAGLPGAKRVAIRGDEVVGFAHWTRHPPYAAHVPRQALEKLPPDISSRLAYSCRLRTW